MVTSKPWNRLAGGHARWTPAKEHQDCRKAALDQRRRAVYFEVGDVDHLHAEFGQSIEPPSLLVGHVALLLESLQACVVRVELEWAVQITWAEDLQSVPDAARR